MSCQLVSENYFCGGKGAWQMTFRETIEKLLKQMNQEELGLKLGMTRKQGQINISNWKNKTSPNLELHWRVFKTIILELDPLALYEDLSDPEPVLRHNIDSYHRLPKEFKDEYWEEFREATKEEYENNQADSHRRYAQGAKSRAKKKHSS
jgi:hypothetical protein